MEIYNSAKKKAMEGGFNWASDTMRAMLLSDTHTPNIDTHEFLDDVNTNEVSATGYSAGGQTIAGKVNTVDTSNDRAALDGNDVSWTITGALTARYLVIYKDTGNPATSPLLAYEDFGSNQTVNDGDFTIQWNAGGIIRVS